MENKTESEKEIEKELEEKAEKWGDELGNNIGEKIEKNVNKYAEGIFGAIAVTVVLILLNLFYDKIAFLNDDFEKVLPYINFSLVVSIIFNASTIIIHSKKYKRVTQIISNIIFFFIFYKVWIIFPFDTSTFGNPETWDKIIRFIMGLTVFAVGLSTIVEIVKLLSDKD